MNKPIPSEFENKLAAARLRTLDTLCPMCSWEKFPAQCSSKELKARETYNRIMAIQQKYEGAYC